MAGAWLNTKADRFFISHCHDCGRVAYTWVELRGERDVCLSCWAARLERQRPSNVTTTPAPQAQI